MTGVCVLSNVVLSIASTPIWLCGCSVSAAEGHGDLLKNSCQLLKHQRGVTRTCRGSSEPSRPWLGTSFLHTYP